MFGKKPPKAPLYSVNRWMLSFSLVFAILFIICFYWGMFISDPILEGMHMDLMRLAFPGFKGITLWSFVNGIFQSFLWGLSIGWGIAASLNLFINIK